MFNVVGERKYFSALHHSLQQQYAECECESCKQNHFNSPLFKEGWKRSRQSVFLAEENPQNGVFPLAMSENPKFEKIFKTAFNAFKKLFKTGNYKPEDLLNVNEYVDLIEATTKLFSSTIPHETPEEMKAYLEKDAFVFSGLKTHTQLTEARSYLKDSNGNIVPYYQFEQKVLKLNQAYNRNYLEAEYQFAVSSSQSAANWVNLQDNTDRYWLEYRTAGDEKVRDSHAALNGVCLPKTDPFWQEFYPPNGWRCRCTAVEVLAREKTMSNSKTAIDAGQKATTHIGKNGANKLAMFRFNPGAEKKMFPPKNAYTPKYCKNGKTTLTGYANVLLSLEDQRCEVQRNLENEVEKRIETWETIPTKKGNIKVSSLHGKNEKTENIEIATYFANKYNHKIDLLAKSDIKKTADTFNHSLNIDQEYKRISKPTKSAIDNAIRSGKNQSDNIVLDIKADFLDGDLRSAIVSRINRSETIKTITIIRNGSDKTYNRKDIIKKGWNL